MFRLNPNNRLALDIYEKTVSLSGFDYNGNSDFGKLELVMNTMIMESIEMTPSEYELLMRKVTLIRLKRMEIKARKNKDG